MEPESLGQLFLSRQGGMSQRLRLRLFDLSRTIVQTAPWYLIAYRSLKGGTGKHPASIRPIFPIEQVNRHRSKGNPTHSRLPRAWGSRAIARANHAPDLRYQRNTYQKEDMIPFSGTGKF
jgi:hypothetical protein